MKQLGPPLAFLSLTAVILRTALIPQALAHEPVMPDCNTHNASIDSSDHSSTVRQAGTHEKPTTKPKARDHASQPDFNGDGCSDLAIGVAREDITGPDQGLVQIMYGGPKGLSVINAQTWHRDGGYDNHGNFLGDIQGSTRDSDEFGFSLATGDYNNDGFSDLAIGVPVSRMDEHRAAGAVHIIFGSANGLTAINNQFWSQDGSWIDPEGNGSSVFLGDIQDGAEEDDYLGISLATGNFNGDDYDDLAIGVAGEAIGSIKGAGAANVLYGAKDGLTWRHNQFISQGGIKQQEDNGDYTYLGDLIGGSEENDILGYSLAAGDFNGDGYDELAVGAFGEALGSLASAGAVNIIRGSESGLTPFNNEHWHQKAAYLDTDADGKIDRTLGDPPGFEEADDWFGFSLTVGNFDGDEFEDLAIGVPREDLSIDGIEIQNAGITQVIYGAKGGLNIHRIDLWQQDGEYSIVDLSDSKPEYNDLFGQALASGDLNGDGISDLIIAAPGESFSEIGFAVGAVNVIYGTGTGLDVPEHQWFYHGEFVEEGSTYESPVGEPSEGIFFGLALTTGDLNGDGHNELVVGSDYRINGAGYGVGAINLFYGSSKGITLKGNQLWTQDGGYDDDGHFLGDLYEEAEPGDQFGGSLP